jgi:hypothetical protein
MTDAKPLVPPERTADETTKNTLLFLSELWAEGEHPAYPISYEIDRGMGTQYRATVKGGDGRVLLVEQIDIRPTINAWITDLLERAEKARASA